MAVTQLITSSISNGSITSDLLASSLTISGNMTVGNLLGPHANGTSTVNIPSVNGNVNISSAGNANILIITGTGANVTGNFAVSGNITQAGASLTTTGKSIAMAIVFGG